MKRASKFDLTKHDFRSIIRKRLESTGMNLTVLAQRSGVSKSTLSRYLAGATEDCLGDNVHRVLRALDLRIVATGI